ncbi:hydantoin utilization protein B [Bordetella pertussis]|nr:hydantoin utilization protein B [Bordetella pertussis]
MFAALAGSAPPQDGGAQDIERLYAQLSQRYADLPSPQAIAAASGAAA